MVGRVPQAMGHRHFVLLGFPSLQYGQSKLSDERLFYLLIYLVGQLFLVLKKELSNTRLFGR